MTDEKRSSVGTELPKEMARVRDELIPLYEGLPNNCGAIGATLLRAELDAAAKAMAEGDLVAMIQSYESLRDAE